MNKFTAFLILSVSYSCLYGQDYFSKLTPRAETASVVQNFELGEKNFTLGYQNDSTLNYTPLVISTIDDSGYVTEAKRMGLSIGRRTAVVDEALYLLGTRDTSIVIMEIDDELNEELLIEIAYPKVIDHIGASKLLMTETAFYAAGWGRLDVQHLQIPNKSREDEGWIVKVDRATMMMDTIVIVPHTGWSDQRIYDMEFMSDSTIAILTLDNPIAFNHTLQFNFYNLSLDFENSIGGFVPSSRTHFETLEDKVLLYSKGSIDNERVHSGLWALTKDGEKLWELNLDKFFPDSLVLDVLIRDMRFLDDGHLLLCGHMWSATQFTTGDVDGIILCIDENGEVLWHRRYRPGTTTLDLSLISFMEVEDGYIFSGHSSSQYLAGIPNHIWTLKTDTRGCIDDECTELQIVEVEELLQDVTPLIIAPNPSDGLVHIAYEGKHIDQLQVYDASGQLVKSMYDVHSRQPIDMTSESDGLYYFLIMDKSNERYYSAKVMITRR